MKRISIIIALTMFLGVVIFNSCKKEGAVQKTENRYIGTTSKGNVGIDRLFDENYIDTLIKVSGIDPKVLSKSPLLLDYYRTSEQINECFRTKFLTILENDITQAEYYMDLIQQATNLINNGDTLGSLNKVNQVYHEIGCASPIGFDYREQTFFIPTNIDEIKAAKISYNKLINAFPTLEKIDEQYKNDILALAFVDIMNPKSQHTGGGECRGRYYTTCAVALIGGASCNASCSALIIPALIVAGQLVCLATTCAVCYYAYQDYQTCLGH